MSRYASKHNIRPMRPNFFPHIHCSFTIVKKLIFFIRNFFENLSKTKVLVLPLNEADKLTERCSYYIPVIRVFSHVKPLNLYLSAKTTILEETSAFLFIFSNFLFYFVNHMTRSKLRSVLGVFNCININMLLTKILINSPQGVLAKKKNKKI
jgi:hypothetical protein